MTTDVKSVSSPAAGTQARTILLAGLGSFFAFAVIGWLASASGQPLILGSFGATCVLLFGFPQGPFSQPRHVIGGHLLTTACGLLFLHTFGPGWLAMAAATACALMLMMATRTVHPPAGSNPVIVYLGHAGWSFLFLPVAAGAILLVLIGWIYWTVLLRRRWPAT
jgi:CBS-domain-containing membrane protein